MLNRFAATVLQLTGETEMRSAILFLAAITSAILLGCASPIVVKPMYVRGFPNPFFTIVPCDTKDCSLMVTVKDCAAGSIDVANILDLSPGPSGQRSVTWTITNSQGYEFSDEKFKYGIFIKLDGGDEFKNVQITGGGKSLTINYTKQGSATAFYSYALTVRRTDGNKNFCKTLDPWLIS